MAVTSLVAKIVWGFLILGMMGLIGGFGVNAEDSGGRDSSTVLKGALGPVVMDMNGFRYPTPSRSSVKNWNSSSTVVNAMKSTVVPCLSNTSAVSINTTSKAAATGFNVTSTAAFTALSTTSSTLVSSFSTAFTVSAANVTTTPSATGLNTTFTSSTVSPSSDVVTTLDGSTVTVTKTVFDAPHSSADPSTSTRLVTTIYETSTHTVFGTKTITSTQSFPSHPSDLTTENEGATVISVSFDVPLSSPSSENTLVSSAIPSSAKAPAPTAVKSDVFPTAISAAACSSIVPILMCGPLCTADVTMNGQLTHITYLCSRTTTLGTHSSAHSPKPQPTVQTTTPGAYTEAQTSKLRYTVYTTRTIITTVTPTSTVVVSPRPSSVVTPAGTSSSSSSEAVTTVTKHLMSTVFETHTVYESRAMSLSASVNGSVVTNTTSTRTTPAGVYWTGLSSGNTSFTGTGTGYVSQQSFASQAKRNIHDGRDYLTSAIKTVTIVTHVTLVPVEATVTHVETVSGESPTATAAYSGAVTLRVGGDAQKERISLFALICILIGAVLLI
ncbi:hypothetical protein K469DRAFT_746559 [Zopfia rhizophila CBS 207.26]|uniref:Uncharacterized protein n=1 Tax=Zopfia rhizophila CBS 207.26 TaxID=1314779 RepID=A0A6A6EK48_9PEZI|nr:hypothetical protein K469DRAFT_746559 [Zopfia rhizophila CBS 207.26]